MSPRSQEQNEKIREARITQIRRAAFEVYMEKGVQGAEMGDIAKRAGIARGLVYYYYKDKMELFQKLFRDHLEQAKAFVSRTLLTDEEPMVRLDRYARFYLVTAITKPQNVHFYRKVQYDLPSVFGEEGTAILEDFIREIYGPLIQTVEEGVRCGLLRDMEPRLLAQTFWGGVGGAMLELSQRPISEAEGERIIEQVIDVIFNGMKISE